MKPSARLQRNEALLNSLKRRHQNLNQAIGDSAAIFVSLAESHHPAARRVGYRTSSTFRYLAGLNEPDAVVVFAPYHPTHKRILFLRERDDLTELWNGPMLGVDGAVNVLGFDAAFPIRQLAEKLPLYLKGARGYYWDNDPALPYHQTLKQLIENSHGRIRGAALHTDTKNLVSEFRVIKDEWEVQQIQRASDITSRAFEHVIRHVRTGMFEYEVQAALEQQMLARDSKWRGYESIVASGENACCLHYTVNNSRLEAGELLLIDAGTEINGYTADVTRTFPVDKKFSPEQKLIYEMVLHTQKELIASVKPGTPFFSLSQKMVELLTEKLVSEKIVKLSLSDLRANKTYRTKGYIPHGSGHYLGLDVHDVGRMGVIDDSLWDDPPVSGRPLEPGMVITVEPGLYFRPGDDLVDPRFYGIGIRIEDDIMVTAAGYHNFTSCVKDVADLENLV